MVITGGACDIDGVTMPNTMAAPRRTGKQRSGTDELCSLRRSTQTSCAKVGSLDRVHPHAVVRTPRLTASGHLHRFPNDQEKTMKKGPILTLLVGVVVAGILLVLSSNAASKRDAADSASSVGDNPATATSAAPKSAPPTTAAANLKATFAGKVDGGAATVAIAVNKGKAVAYLCDGNVTEAWLSGTATDGKLALKGDNGSLNGTFTNGRATGDVKAGRKSWHFTAATVKPPSGLYRSAANVRNAKVVGGWIVLSDGSQVGITTVAGTPESAGKLDTTSLTSTLDGDTLTATAVDGDAALE
jgi:hypothetical protein